MTISKAITAKFSFEGKRYSFSVNGRPPTLIRNVQGDHVTAYGLVKRGIVNRIKNRDIDLSDASGIRVIRDEMYSYMSGILSLHRDKVNFFKELEGILNDYNNQRASKKDLKSTKKLLDQLEKAGTHTDDLAALKRLIDLHEEGNIRLVQNSLARMTELCLSHYNKIPSIAFLKIQDCPTPANKESGALNYLDKYESANPKETADYYKGKISKKNNATPGPKSKTIEKLLGEWPDSMNEIEKFNKKIAFNKIMDLFFYPNIPRDILAKHTQASTELFKEKAEKINRNNGVESFARAIARHVFVLHQAYPMLRSKFPADELIKDMIQELHLKEPYAWDLSPSKRSKAFYLAKMDYDLWHYDQANEDDIGQYVKTNNLCSSSEEEFVLNHKEDMAMPISQKRKGSALESTASKTVNETVDASENANKRKCLKAPSTQVNRASQGLFSTGKSETDTKHRKRRWKLRTQRQRSQREQSISFEKPVSNFLRDSHSHRKKQLIDYVDKQLDHKVPPPQETDVRSHKRKRPSSPTNRNLRK